jgi:hypothetical protein
MIVRTFVRNGTSFKEKGMDVISVVQTLPVVDAINNVSTTNVDEHKQPSTTQKQHRSSNDGLNGSERSYSSIKAEVLEVKLAFSEKEAKEWKQRAEKAEAEREKLYRENMELQRENRIKDDKHDLDKQKAVSESKSGLSGFMEDVKSLPAEGWQFLAGCFPNHPMAKALPGGNPETQTGQFHTDNDAHICILGMTEALKNQQPEVVGMVALITNKLLESPSVRNAVYTKLFPAEPAEKKEPSTT